MFFKEVTYSHYTPHTSRLETTSRYVRPSHWLQTPITTTANPHTHLWVPPVPPIVTIIDGAMKKVLLMDPPDIRTIATSTHPTGDVPNAPVPIATVAPVATTTDCFLTPVATTTDASVAAPATEHVASVTSVASTSDFPAASMSDCSAVHDASDIAHVPMQKRHFCPSDLESRSEDRAGGQFLALLARIEARIEDTTRAGHDRLKAALRKQVEMHRPHLQDAVVTLMARIADLGRASMQLQFASTSAATDTASRPTKGTVVTSSTSLAASQHASVNAPPRAERTAAKPTILQRETVDPTPKTAAKANPALATTTRPNSYSPAVNRGGNTSRDDGSWMTVRKAKRQAKTTDVAATITTAPKLATTCRTESGRLSSRGRQANRDQSTPNMALA
ncbi:hypothetical protein FN846DRAFT_913821 [Sphaerosporella brunnea]|uniref:Uncharacterized protein n=1 Tax=Sphaerosporella brunnea TaxID=1250544 RepID=A0A5J5EEL5_9PEZI|nr:hypothetical protein FN846DRAFT_913821 [Sphaerosporella brunnea]